jgi:DNA-binding XRE family transcriptional regulator
MELALETQCIEPAAFACEISYQIQGRRLELKWSREHLAKKAQISEFTIFNLEKGKGWADLYTVGALFCALDIHFEDLGKKKWPALSEFHPTTEDLDDLNTRS